ncbi:MAG: polysaccharide biosynthesis tyrosine autokinase [Calothrix sp. C42_A2020_038]|nr:polysaccharide biosynthesis tyrosine autokinase [Calothrix sp. C42_A2020_038]
MGNLFQSSSSDRDRSQNDLYTEPVPLPWSEQGDSSSFRDFFGIIRRRLFVVIGVATIVIGINVNSVVNQKKEYESSFRLLVEPVNEDSTALDITKDPNLTKSILDYESQIQVLKSPDLLRDVIEKLQKSYPDINYDILVNSLTVVRLGETKIIEVRYRGDNLEQVHDIANHIAQDYLKYSLEKRQTKLRQGIGFVEKQLPTLQKRVDTIQRDLQIFRQLNNFVNPETQAQQIAEQVNILSQQRLAVDQLLAQADKNLSELRKQNGQLGVLNDATVYQQLLVQVRQIETQIAAELARFQEDSPTIRTLRERRDNLLPLLTQEAQRFMNVKLAQANTQVQALKVQSEELAKAEKKLQEQRKQLPVLSRKYTELQSKLQVATESLNRFLTTRETLQIQIAQTELPWQLIQPPSKPQSPINADTRRGLIMALLGSIAVGVGAAVLLEKLDNTYHTVAALKEAVKLPLLGNIPFERQLQNEHNRLSKQNNTRLTELKQAINSKHPNIPELTITRVSDYGNYSEKFLEALRVLYTNIQFLSSDRPIRSIVVSSAMTSDGKSTIAFHLAKIAAVMGQRVLLVDANLRQPTIHNFAELNNLWGLSNLISTNSPIEEVIREFPQIKELSIITSGVTPPDPIKLLSSEKMKRLMAEFQNMFDLVIYDTPHLVELADASLLAPHTNGILLAVRMDKTDSSVLKRALDNLKLSRMNILGVVSNAQKRN